MPCRPMSPWATPIITNWWVSPITAPRADIWYRLLNLGFRLPAGAGTDAMANYASLRGPVGMNRVFIAIVGRGHAGKTALGPEAGPDLRE